MEEEKENVEGAETPAPATPEVAPEAGVPAEGEPAAAPEEAPETPAE